MRVAKALLFDADKNALVLRRSGTHPHHAYEPDLPGGIIERGESYEEGLAREVFEEAGIAVEPNTLKLVATREGYGFSNKRLYVVELIVRPEVTISWEHDKYDWVPYAELVRSLDSTDSYMHFVADYISKNALY